MKAPKRPARIALLETEIAVRAYAPRSRAKRPGRSVPTNDLVLVLDTETLTDHTQALLFGSYRIYFKGKLRQEGVFHADDLPTTDVATLRSYAEEHAADNGGTLRVRTLTGFLNSVFWKIAYKGRARVVGFNLPFDLSRLACGWRRSRSGGFSLMFFEVTDADGRVWRNQYRPEISVKSAGAKRNFHKFTGLHRKATEHKEDGAWYAGRFVDLHTFVYAYTDQSLSLDAASREFGLEVGKSTAEEHGVVTAAYIDYNRQDVRVTWELYRALMVEWARHPIDLEPEQVFSPAKIGKAYLTEIGITPPIARSDVSLERIGQAMTAYQGGRTECRIRRVPLPVRYVDFASMYPTVFALLGLWSWVVAERLSATPVTDDARDLLASLSRESLHDQAVWPRLAGVFCRVRPDGDLLPVRARYGADFATHDPTGGAGSQAWTIGLNHLEADTDMWFTLADLSVAKLLGGSTPTIIEAFRVFPSGYLPDLRRIELRGSVAVDPNHDDLFRVATEERARIKAGKRLSAIEKDRLSQFLKTFANGGSYGIFAEFRQLDPVPGGRMVEAHGLWPLAARVNTPEEPGAFCFPPLAATITGAARLLLGLLQADVEAKGGAYVACDTDSLLIVSSEADGLVACPGGPERLPDGRAAVRALAWAAVSEILAGLEPLNPYARGTVPALIKLERENFALDDPTRPIELIAYAGSSKRYALYERGATGVILRKASEHGLGLYRSPLPRRDDWAEAWPEWVDVVWRRFIAEAEGEPIEPAPAWFDLPAVSHLPISSPPLLAPFARMNKGQSYADQVKPFGFLTMGHVDPLASLPVGVARDDVTPLAPFTADPDGLLDLPWCNRRDGTTLAVTTRPGGVTGKIRLQTYGGVVADYRLHPETKGGDPRGGLGRRGSVGLLPRLRVRAVGLPVHIGKESNRLEEVHGGLVTDPDDVYVVYRDPRREWEAALPALGRLREEKGWRCLADASGLSERAIRYAINGGKMPHREARELLMHLVRA